MTDDIRSGLEPALSRGVEFDNLDKIALDVGLLAIASKFASPDEFLDAAMQWREFGYLLDHQREELKGLIQKGSTQQ